MMLQIVPDGKGDENDFEHLVQLTETVKNEELFELEAEEVLYRLYHQETVQLFDPQAVEFMCGCSRDKSAAAIVSLGRDEADTILAENGNLTLHCDYCNADYVFDSIDVAALFENGAVGSNQVH